MLKYKEMLSITADYMSQVTGGCMQLTMTQKANFMLTSPFGNAFSYG